MSRLFFIAIVAAFAFLHPSVTFSQDRPYQVGIILPLSGPIASMGEYVRRGLDLGLTSLPPEERRLLEVRYEDDQFDPVKTIAAYHKLSADKQLDAVIVVGSAPALALAPITEKEEQILLAIGASDPQVVKDRRFAFTHWVIPKVLGERLAAELLDRGFQRMAFLTASTPGALADSDATVESLWAKNADAKIVFNERFLMTQIDFKTTIAKLKNRNPDVIVLALAPGALSSFAKQARELHLTGELAGVETFEDPSEVKASDGALLGAWYVNASDPSDDFVAAYKSIHHEYPGWASANSYDTVHLFAKGVKERGVTNQGLRNFFAELKDFSGGAGRYSASGDNRFLLPAALKRVTAEGFVTIPTSRPSATK